MKTPRPVWLTNTVSQKKEPLKTLEPGKVKFYSCGPTVYGFIHIGNLRAALTGDLIFRALSHLGYEVTFVRNYTDIDDKIIKRANDEHTSMDQISKRYIQEVEKDYALAGMKEPTYKTLVTTHIPEILKMVETLIEKKHAYVTPSGDVNFSVDSFPTYGGLSKKPLEDLKSGARVEVNPEKKNPLDFALWKAAKPGEPSWDSSWGKGRPGWHIECSAMAGKWLGDQMDLHHGGEDLIFPHHENEIAQSEACSGHGPYVGLWVHNAFLTFSKEKMSKSLGNVVQARDFLSEYGGEVARMLFFSVHYRSTFDFNATAVDHAVSGLMRIYEAKAKAESLLVKKVAMPDPLAETAWGQFMSELSSFPASFQEALAQDLNTPEALSKVFHLVREWNKAVSFKNAENTPSAILCASSFIAAIEKELGAVLGVGILRSETAISHLNAVIKKRMENEGVSVLSDEEIEALIQARLDARAKKDFKRSDEIRDELKAKGVIIKDSPQGTTWSRGN